ncbi:MAG: ECF transporter S component [Oscillospiraceae bacterium]|nr:ECF transporter S component [Oscillospiraceae bacterium]
MKKSNIATLIVFFLLIPVTLFFGSKLPGRGYYITGTAIILELMIPFFMAFEGKKPQARELVVIAVMCAIAIAARVAIPIPNFKAIFAVIMLSGIAFGPEAGFMVGAISAFASNFFYGQGPYTPWQMMAYGAGGMLAGFCFAKGRLPKKPLTMAVFGFLAVVLWVGPLLDTSSVFLMLSDINWNSLLLTYGAGLSVNISQAACTVLIMLLFGRPLLDKLDRIKVKYGMMEDENGL